MMKYLCLLACCVLILTTSVQSSEKWSWGKEDSSNSSDKSSPVKEEIVGRSASKDFSQTTVESSENFSKDSSIKKGGVRPPALPEGRTFKLFKKLGCRLGLGCDDVQRYPSFGGPPPVYSVPGPIISIPGPAYPPLPLGPAPYPPQAPYPQQAPYLPQAPYPSPPTYGPIAAPIPQASSIYPQPAKISYPLVQKPTLTEHHHTHTHIHEGLNSHESDSPYKLTGYPPKPGFGPTVISNGYPPKPSFTQTVINNGYPPKKGFSPTVINGGSHLDDSHESFGSGHNFASKPIAVRPEAVTGTLYRPAKSFYTEDCHCVIEQYCSSYDVVRQNFGKDIIHLVNPRTEGASVLSNATDYKRPIRSKRDTLITNRQPAAVSKRTASARAIDGFSPGLSGCGHGYVCCRNSVQEPKHFDGVCGKSLKSSIHGRIANTEYNRGATQFGEFPWQGAILKDKNYESAFVCGATLVSPQHVLTAAHCIVDQPYHSLRVRLGDWDVNGVAEFYKHVEFPVQTAEIHPKFYAGNLNNDIAVLTLQGYVDFHSSPHISPICLPNQYADFTHQHCFVTGWGKDAFGHSGEFQQILKKVDVPVVDRKSCQYALQEAKLGKDYYLPEGFICAGGEEGKDTCKGDGGGPLVCPTRYNTYELAGIVSWGIGCGLRGVPGVYVNIPYYVDWIKSIVQH